MKQIYNIIYTDIKKNGVYKYIFMMILHDTFNMNEKGHLEIGGCDAVDLVKEYGTPLYILDETKIRKNCTAYREAFKKYFNGNGEFLYASKALSFKEIYRIMESEKAGIDIASLGEMETAKAVDYSLENAYFHGNNKTDFDIETAIRNKVGYFVADNLEEINAINTIAGRYNIKQKILLRVSPGIDPGTHRKIVTGSIDSKFGIAIGTGQALEAIRYILKQENIDFLGVHCHIGSQILDLQPFIDTADCMLDFVAEIKKVLGYEAQTVNLGGGFGIRYLNKQTSLDIDSSIKLLSEFVYKKCGELSVKVPKIILEPGRSIVANAGATLYTVGTNKKITGYKQYISVDGGMADNIRYALYEAPYTIVAANKMREEANISATIVGRCCESGDFIQENVSIPDVERGDILAVLVTGAYNYSMASNYNRLPRPAMIMTKNGNHRLVVKRESYQDLMLNEI